MNSSDASSATGWRPIAVALLLATSFRAGAAQEMAVPPVRQVDLLTRVLEFDRNLHARVTDQLVVAVLHEGDFPASVNAAEAVAAELRGRQVGGVPVKPVAVVVERHRSLYQALAESGAGAIYVCALRTTDVGEVVAATRQLDILSFTGVPEYVDHGLAVGLSAIGDRSEIIVDVAASVWEGAVLSSELLKISRVIVPDEVAALQEIREEWDE